MQVVHYENNPYTWDSESDINTGVVSINVGSGNSSVHVLEEPITISFPLSGEMR